MNVFKNKKRWKNKKNVKKRALNKKHKKRFLIYETLRWYGHVLRKDDDDWVKKMYYFRGWGSETKSRPRKTRKKVVDKDMNDLIWMNEWIWTTCCLSQINIDLRPLNEFVFI